MSARTFPFLGEVEVTWRRSAVGAALGAAIFLALPLFVGSYWTNVGIDIMVVVLFAMSFNLLFGYTGLLSFGHAAFYGFAAYVVALTLAGSVSFVPTVGSLLPAFLLAVLATVVVAAVFGVLCVQRGGIFFAMLTLALNMMLYEIAFQWEDLTGGANGTTLPVATVDLGVVSFSALDKTLYYYFTFALVVVALLVLWRIVHSPYGELLAAIRENPERAEFVGVNVKLYQWSAFVLSGVFAGLAGALVSVQLFVVAPVVLHWSTSAIPVLATLLGGPTTFFGPVLGGIIFVLLEEGLTTVTQFWEIAIGIIIIPIVLFLPGGILGALLEDGGVRERLARVVRSKQPDEEP